VNGLLQQLINQQAALVAAAAQGSTFISPVAALSSPHVTVGSLTAMANGGLPQPAAAAAGNGITTTAAGRSTHLPADTFSMKVFLFMYVARKSPDYNLQSLVSLKLRRRPFRFTKI